MYCSRVQVQGAAGIGSALTGGLSLSNGGATPATGHARTLGHPAGLNTTTASNSTGAAGNMTGAAGNSTAAHGSSIRRVG